MARSRMFVRNKWASATAWLAFSSLVSVDRLDFLRNFKLNLLAGYRWMSEKYLDGDRIYLLGTCLLYRSVVLNRDITQASLEARIKFVS